MPAVDDADRPVRDIAHSWAMTGAIPRELTDGRPFTVPFARQLGIDPQVLRGARFRAVLRGVYVWSATADSPLLRLDAALLLAPPGAAASHRSAAAVLALPVPPSPLASLTVPSGSRRPRMEGLRVHQVRDLPAPRMVSGRPVVEPTMAFLQLAEPSTGLGGVDLVTAGDALVRHWCGLEELQAAAHVRSNRGRRARAALAYVRCDVDSAPETRLRLLLVLAGLPEPKVGHVVRDSAGGWIARPDLSYPDQRIAIEYEGEHHLIDARQWSQDIARQENMEELGWLVLRITARDLFVRPAVTVTRVLAALRRRDHPDAPAMRHLTGLAWPLNFPAGG